MTEVSCERPAPRESDRPRIKIADVGVVPLKAARLKSNTILAEKQLYSGKPATSPSSDNWRQPTTR
jgi:hypothetical protein